MWKREMSRLLDERAERIVALEQRLEKSSALIETYRAREQTIVDSLASSQAEAKQRIAEAEEKADALIGKARRTAENASQAAEKSASELIARAEAYRDELIRGARSKAEEMLQDAQKKSSAMLAQAQAAVAEYSEALVRYNSLIEESAARAQAQAKQYASFVKTQKLITPEMTETAKTLADAPYAAPVILPDVEDNPAQLMRNIYTLEKREIPEEAAVRPAYPTPSVEAADVLPTESDSKGTPKPEPVRAVEPEIEELPDLAPRPVQESEQPAVTEVVTPIAPYIAPEELESEELPDLAPHPEPVEWRPEDEAAEPEWQPEAESEEPEPPTVSELTYERNGDDEVEMSLDALLDEIIRAGE